MPKRSGFYLFYGGSIVAKRILFQGDSITDGGRNRNHFINLNPDYANIHIGVNDTWHEISNQNGVKTDKFEKIYTMLIDEVKAACPEIKLIFKKDVAEKAGVAKTIAEKYGLPLIELQPAFDEVCEKAPAQYWTADGVHPTPYGHEIIKRLWIETFQRIK